MDGFNSKKYMVVRRKKFEKMRRELNAYKLAGDISSTDANLINERLDLYGEISKLRMCISTLQDDIEVLDERLQEKEYQKNFRMGKKKTNFGLCENYKPPGNVTVKSLDSINSTVATFIPGSVIFGQKYVNDELNSKSFGGSTQEKVVDIMSEIKDEVRSTIKIMREKHFEALSGFTDKNIEMSFREYSNYFHAATWASLTCFKHFVEWATKSPLERNK